MSVSQVLEKVRTHDFHPLEKGSMTYDGSPDKHGIADLDNQDWKVRLLAVRDLVRAGLKATAEIAKGLQDENQDVRQVCAMTLGILRAEPAIADLERVLQNDSVSMVRSQAAIALGQIESTGSLELLRKTIESDSSKDVYHQCELAIDQIQKKMGTTPAQLAAYQNLDETQFETVQVGSAAPDFTLNDTEDKPWRLSEYKEKNWVVLIWVFADWCPVCHSEFRELIKMREPYQNAKVQVVTIEAHDRYRARVMVGKEVDPKYWFVRESFQDAYTKNIWWPHLQDHAGAIGAIYGVDPLAFAVHSEYINRPSAVIVDPSGIVRYAHFGTYWGDRPTIKETLQMILDEKFDH